MLYWHELTPYEQNLVRSVLTSAPMNERDFRSIAIRAGRESLIVRPVYNGWVPDKHPDDEGPNVVIRPQSFRYQPLYTSNTTGINFNVVA